MRFNIISQPANRRSDGEGHQDGNDAESTAESKGDGDYTEVKDHAYSAERHIWQTHGNNVWNRIIGRGAEIDNHVKSGGKNEQDK